MKKHLGFIAILFLIFSACKDEDTISVPSANYLPLEVGNYWEFDYSQKKEIVGEKTVNGKSYFVLVTGNDTAYYRVENYKVYVIEWGASAETMEFNLGGKLNSSWKYNSYTVKLASKNDTITINGKKITNCYRFYFDIPDAIDDEHDIWLAPGIGFIQSDCWECPYPVLKLNKARIGGESIEF